MSIRPAPRTLVTLILALAACGVSLPGVRYGGLEAEEKAKKKAPGEDEAKTAKKKKTAKKEAPAHDFAAWGTIKEVKGTAFHTLAYMKTDGKKATKGSAFFKVAEDAAFYQDRAGVLSDLKDGDAIWLLGRPVESDQPSIQGQSAGGVDRQIQNVSAIAVGESLEVKEKYKDPKDPKVKWCQAVVAKAGPPLSVTFEGAEFKVVMGRQVPVLIREKAEAKPLKSGIQVEVSADKSPERPETKSAADEKKEAFVAKRVVLLDRRLAQNIYPMMLE